MAIRHLASRAATWLRCKFSRHELIMIRIPADPDAGQPGAIRLRCLHCSHVTPGWEQGRPAYAVRPGCGRKSDVPPSQPAVSQVVEPQPVEAPAAEPGPVPVAAKPARKRRRKRVRRPAILPVAAAGGGRRVVKFPLARGSRSR